MKYHSKKDKNNIATAMYICIKNNVKAYPIQFEKTTFHLIRVEWKGKPTTYNKILKTPKEVNEAMKKTYIFLANKLGS